MKAFVLLNRAAGTLAAMNDPQGHAVAKALSDAGIDADIRLLESREISKAVEKAAASNVDVVIVGGGDGTLSTVAGALAGSQMPLGILPLGTLNHFAKDLGIPMDLNGAAQVIAAGHIGHIDVAELNGRVFINNSSLGVYPRAVLERNSQQSRHGLRKWTAMGLAVLKVFRRFPLVHVRLTTDSESLVRKTPLVFVGNNRYEMDLFNVGKRVCLDRGELSLYIANTQSRWGMVLLSLRAILGRLEQARDFEVYCLSNCWIETRRHRLHVAMDGEVRKLSPPLEYRARPGALRVCLPEKTNLESHAT